jgi:hypothetical protein
VDAVVLGRKLGIEVRAESEERDVAEVEEAGVPDDDVETKTEKRVQQRENSVAEEVAAAHPEWQRCRERGEEHEPRRCREKRDSAAQQPGEPGVALAPVLDLRDPLVHADARPVACVGRCG